MCLFESIDLAEGGWPVPLGFSKSLLVSELKLQACVINQVDLIGQDKMSPE